MFSDSVLLRGLITFVSQYNRAFQKQTGGHRKSVRNCYEGLFQLQYFQTFQQTL